MAGTYGAFKTDKDREKKGITLDMGEAGKFKLARAGGANELFKKKLATLTRPYRKAIQTGNLDEVTADRLMVEAYVDTVLLGWEGVTGEDGSQLSYSRENAIKLMTDLPDLFKSIRETADDASLFRQDILEGDAKN